MRKLIRFLFTVAVVGLVVLGGAWWWAGRMDGPAVDLKTPQKFIGRATAMELSVQAPGGQFSRVDVTLEQNGQTYRCLRWSSRASLKCDRKRRNGST